jgi:hypothetical protein
MQSGEGEVRMGFESLIHRITPGHPGTNVSRDQRMKSAITRVLQ